MTTLVGLLAERMEQSDYRKGCPIATVALEVAATNEPLRRLCADTYADWQSTLAELLTEEGRGPGRRRRDRRSRPRADRGRPPARPRPAQPPPAGPGGPLGRPPAGLITLSTDRTHSRPRPRPPRPQNM
ncbi:hypothetical protein GCM10020229_60190 [Kitasatospora albolonga]|uniref:LmrA/YxaF family transcription factor n=1 Tax=Kitasatospora albolonga TaxID=68173 RepID=UPI0031E871F9